MRALRQLASWLVSAYSEQEAECPCSTYRADEDCVSASRCSAAPFVAAGYVGSLDRKARANGE